MVIVEFFGKVTLQDGTMERFMNQLVCHVFLLTLSMVNVIYLFFIGILGRGGLPFLQKLALGGALMQMGSCANSITRYNIEDEYNYTIANAGAFFGLAAGCFNNIALSVILFHNSDNRKFKWRVFSIFLIVLSIVLLCMEMTTFEDTGFFYFRVLNMLSVPFTALCCWMTKRALEKGTLTLPESTSTEEATGVFKVLGLFFFISFFVNLTGYTILIYISGGLAFGAVNVATYYMELMEGLYEKPAATVENQPLV